MNEASRQSEDNVQPVQLKGCFPGFDRREHGSRTSYGSLVQTRGSRSGRRPRVDWRGLIPIPELKDLLGLKNVPEEERYHTLSGMLMMLLGRLPQTTHKVEWEGWRFEVVDLDGKRVDKVLASALATEPVAPAGAGAGA